MFPVSAAMAQAYPVKPVRLIVGYTPGGGADTTARLVAQKLSEALGRQVVVENRPGASGTIATERVATAPPDGYTLLLMTTGDTVQPALRTKLPYDLQRDLAPISQPTAGPSALTTYPSVPARNIKELIVLARMHPGKLSFGSSGVGASPHLAAELFEPQLPALHHRHHRTLLRRGRRVHEYSFLCEPAQQLGVAERRCDLRQALTAPLLSRTPRRSPAPR